jgi:hypothetical protein
VFRLHCQLFHCHPRRSIPLPFVPVEPYPELGRIFNDALCHLRTLSVHSAQHDGIWNDIWNNISSLREIFVYPGAELWYLWQWAMRQYSLMTLGNCWKHSSQPWWNPSGPTYRGPLVFADLQTLITDTDGATELLPKSVVVELIIQNIPQPSSFSEYSIHVAHYVSARGPCRYAPWPVHRLFLTSIPIVFLRTRVSDPLLSLTASITLRNKPLSRSRARSAIYRLLVRPCP